MNSEVNSNQPSPEATPVCERCGKFGAKEFGDATLCEDCYTGAGSCCPEFGADDLWEECKDPDE